MHIFLAGSTGVLGRRIIPLLLAGDHRVTALTRSPARVNGLRVAGATPVVADALDGAAVAATVASARPDVVMHQLTDLASGNTAANADLRIRSTRNLVDAASACGVRRMISQSIGWAYGPGSGPAAEDEPLDTDAAEPRATSIRGVVALETATCEVPEPVVLRFGTLYGPDTWFAPGGSRADDAQAGRLVADMAVTSFLHVDDAARAAVEALGWPAGTVNVCDDEPATGAQWVPLFCRIVGAPAPPEDSGERAPWARGADNRLARKGLGFVPDYLSWRDGFAAMAGG